MRTHTPGPWTIATDGPARILRIDSAEGPIASIYVHMASHEDARLIAAAPDMLETLRDIVGMLADVNDMRADALHAARAAIVRATGGQA